LYFELQTQLRTIAYPSKRGELNMENGLTNSIQSNRSDRAVAIGRPIATPQNVGARLVERSYGRLRRYFTSSGSRVRAK
jgi:hypothetical protein